MTGKRENGAIEQTSETSQNSTRRDLKVSFCNTNEQHVFDSRQPHRNVSKVIPKSENKNDPTSLCSGLDIKSQTIFQKYTSCRWATTYICFGVIMASVMLRQCISMAVICIENNVKVINQSLSNTTGVTQHIWNIVWDSETEGLVISSYFYGFPITPVLGGYLSGKFSGKNVVTVMTIVLIVSSLLIPISATYSSTIVIVLRCIVGLSSGGLNPSISAILSKWAPTAERSQITAVTSAGLMVGTIFTFMLSGLICDIPWQNGWPFIFYIFSFCNIIGLIMWLLLVYDSPDLHPRVEWTEIALITRNRRDSTIEKMPNPPWMDILKSPPFWGLLFAHVSHGFLFTTIGTFLPIYMNDVLLFDSTSNGLLSSLPFVGRLFGTIASGFLSDFLLTKRVFSITVNRKVFQTAGMVVSAPFLLALSFLDHTQRDTVVILLILYWTTQSLNNAGFRVNHLDIAPRFAGILNGLTTTFASLAALVSPVLTSAITVNGTREEWQIVFGICIAVGMVGAIAFAFLGSAKEQEWAKDPKLNMEFDISRHPSFQVNTVHKNSVSKENGRVSNLERQNGSIHNNENTLVVKAFVDSATQTSQTFMCDVSDVTHAYNMVGRNHDRQGSGSSKPINSTNEIIDIITSIPEDEIPSPFREQDSVEENKPTFTIGDDLERKPEEKVNQNGLAENSRKGYITEPASSSFMTRTRNSRENLRLFIPYVNEVFESDDIDLQSSDSPSIITKL